MRKGDQGKGIEQLERTGIVRDRTGRVLGSENGLSGSSEATLQRELGGRGIERRRVRGAIGLERKRHTRATKRVRSAPEVPSQEAQEAAQEAPVQKGGRDSGRVARTYNVGTLARARNRESMRPSYERQLGMFDPTQYDADSAHITIAGLGNIGSHTALALARMGLRHFALYDFDTVEAHNLASQAYSVRDVGKRKVDAIAAQMRALNPAIEIEKHAERYGGICGTSILISAVDNLEARREMAAHSGAGTFVIDGRMGGGQI